MIASALALFLLQSGVNPMAGAMPGIPEELQNRRPRTVAAEPVAPVRVSSRLGECLGLAQSDPAAALNRAQAWREGAQDTLELAQTSHCLGLAMVNLGRFEEATTALEMASDETPLEEPAYRARLAGMAGNAALAANRADRALPLLAGAVEHARPASDAALSAGLMLDQARALVALDRTADAATLLARATATDPANATGWLLAATLERRLDRLAGAQAHIERAAAIDPRDPAIGLEAGVIAALGGRDAAARASFESVVAMAPDSDEAAAAKTYLAQLGAQ